MTFFIEGTYHKVAAAAANAEKNANAKRKLSQDQTTNVLVNQPQSSTAPIPIPQSSNRSSSTVSSAPCTWHGGAGKVSAADNTSAMDNASLTQAYFKNYKGSQRYK